MMICSNCEVEKKDSEFYKGRRQCKTCMKSKRKERYKENPDIQKKRSAEYREKNKEKCIQTVREWRDRNKDYDKDYNKKRRRYDKDEVKDRNKKYWEENKEELKKRHREYYKENKDNILKSNLKYESDRKKSDPLYKMTKNLRCRTRAAFKASRWHKNSSNIDMLGCSFNEAFKHIESQFTEGMSWKNHGVRGWHIDHIIPLCSANTEEELVSLCHYTNLQPLWAKDNLIKGGKI